MLQNVPNRPALTAALLATIAAGVLALAGPSDATAQPGSPRAQAALDLTGTWVSEVTEDWRWRMVVPPQGDYTSIPLSAAGRTAADRWTPDQIDTDGCRPYGAAAIMRVPGRLRISWEDDRTLRIETDAGLQTRRLHFDRTVTPPAEPTWQGHSVAEWVVAAGRGGGRGGARAGSLRVVTTGMRPGYYRRNGVPYSDAAVMTEYFDRHAAYGIEWFTVTTIVEDPRYLTQPFIVTTHFRREASDEHWDPRPCE
jgi:hypothetical protein